VQEIKEILQILRKEYNADSCKHNFLSCYSKYFYIGKNLNILFKTQSQIELLYKEFKINYRVNSYLKKLREIIKVKIDQQWLTKTGVSLHK